MSHITLWNLSSSFCTHTNHFDETFRNLITNQKILFDPVYKDFSTSRLNHENTEEIFQHIRAQSSVFNIQIILLGYADVDNFSSHLSNTLELLLTEAQLSHSFIILGSPIPFEKIPKTELSCWRCFESILKQIAKNYPRHCRLINFRHHFNNSSYFQSNEKLNTRGKIKLAHVLGKTLLVIPKFGI
jgi:hypothetical protein